MNAIIVFILRLCSILISYFFVGWIGYSIFADLRQGRHALTKVQIPTLSLQMKTDQQTQEKKFSKPEVVVGRDPAADLPLSEETISQRHCKISFHHKHWWIEDLGSTNGTYLNGHIIKTPTVITNGDDLRLGQATLSIKID